MSNHAFWKKLIPILDSSFRKYFLIEIKSAFFPIRLPFHVWRYFCLCSSIFSWINIPNLSIIAQIMWPSAHSSSCLVSLYLEFWPFMCYTGIIMVGHTSIDVVEQRWETNRKWKCFLHASCQFEFLLVLNPDYSRQDKLWHLTIK